jgi:hypothetical protein
LARCTSIFGPAIQVGEVALFQGRRTITPSPPPSLSHNNSLYLSFSLLPPPLFSSLSFPLDPSLPSPPYLSPLPILTSSSLLKASSCFLNYNRNSPHSIIHKPSCHTHNHLSMPLPPKCHTPSTPSHHPDAPPDQQSCHTPYYHTWLITLFGHTLIIIPCYSGISLLINPLLMQLGYHAPYPVTLAFLLS